MDDASTTHPALEARSAAPAELDRLYRLVQGLLDADVLLAAEGGALLETIDRARRGHASGDLDAAHRHTTRLGLAMEALAGSGRLEAAHGRAALRAVRRLLSDPAG